MIEPPPSVDASKPVADLNQLSADLKTHLRYPEDLFSIRADQYRTFHMTVPQVFYNREDLWVLPQEKYAGKVAPMQPYFILMKLTGSDRLEYLLMTPFTPQKRNNTDFPQLKRVIMISGDKVAMEPSLDEAIQSVFGTEQPQNPAKAARQQPELGQARAQFDEAQKAMQQGNWAQFGKSMDALKRLLKGPAVTAILQ